ncbi:inositol polyphosphate 5-phosphatase OCRL-1 [Copidosoma floridanum]|uniref:inositol polyphosphate 5-phosphatase OCRL-1 n=1 Tax=Copidosoma floridanum TaxID=29053 RepID=UPI0006C99382|nr:inositol polyphosphate 5-phosphatase OCRL-1 [Copidosoma floridanum]
MIKITEELSGLVQSKFSATEAKVLTMSQDKYPKSLKKKRLVVLLRKDSTHALVTLTTSESAPRFSSDLDIEEVLPIERGFECTTNRAEEFKELSDVFFKVTCRRAKRLFQMAPSARTTDFQSEVFRAIDTYQRKQNPASDYRWIARIAGKIPSIDRIVLNRMNRKRDEYTYKKTLRLFIGTWNVNGQSPEGLTVEGWLRAEDESPDIYAIGFQELDLSTETFLLNETKREDEWMAILSKSLHPTGDYELVAQERLVGLTIFVFAKAMHVPYIRHVVTDTLGVGIMKIMGNKGGVAVSMSVHGTSICFVNTHLAAHMDECARRNQDYACISADIKFEDSPTKKLVDHEQIYWMGDLNYRIADLEADEVKLLIDAQDFKSLLIRDQLNEQRRLGKAFVGFQEQDICFRPTYKYDPGTDDWDSSEKQRAPAWCDRILWRGESVHPLAYRSHPEFKISDHKPISAIFNSEITIVDKHKCHVVYEEVVARIKKKYFIPKPNFDPLVMNSENVCAWPSCGFLKQKYTSVVTETMLIQGWMKPMRLLALVNKGATNALVIFITSRTPPLVYSDLTIEKVLPIDQDFQCDISTPEEMKDLSDVFLNVTCRKNKTVFQMRPGVTTTNLVSNVFQAIETYQKNRNPSTDFLWIQKLIGSVRNLDINSSDEVQKASEPVIEIDSPELVTSRRNIATGKSPIATRESVVRYQMACKEDDYTYTKVFRIFIGTWNVNGQPPSGINLHQWLSSDDVAPDIYAIGFQELDLSKEAFLFNDTPREDEWRQVVAKSLHPKASYEQIALVRLVGMMLIIFAKKSHLPDIKNVCVDTVGTGIMGKMGNKGGVAVSCNIHNTSVCFVNAHLAAHCEEYERRNQDYSVICGKLTFQTYPLKRLKDHDQIYWLGDLNYRITEMDAETAKQLIAAGELAPVLMLDQLEQQRRLKRVFVGFHEAEIKFKPTYKYDPGTDNWDSSEKGRAPAWCDRVLWKGESMNCLDYRSHPELKISDHKPVSSIFDSKIRVIDSIKYRKIHEDLMKKLDKLENEFLPQVTVDTTEIIFDTLKFYESSVKELIVANTGQVPVEFEFIKKLDDTSYCKEWLTITPYTDFIEPGQKCDIKLEICVDKRSAWKLNSGEDKLYDILVLHLINGKDIFITVTGTYERSCFGCSMEALVHIPIPIREVPIGRIMELENNKNVSQDPYSVPKEIWLLVDRLYRHGIKTPGLFVTQGLHSEILAIRDWLDIGSQDPMPGSVHSVAEALLLLLDSTSEPLVPYNLHSVCLTAATNYLQCKQLVMQLPEIRRTVFLYICAFLQELLNHTQDNGLDAKTLASLFGSFFLRDPPRSREDRIQRSKVIQATFDRKKAAFVYHFLVNDQSDFIGR